MKVQVWTRHPVIVRTLMDEYCGVFADKPYDDSREDDLIWYVFSTTSYAVEVAWKQWIAAAKLTGLIYEGAVG